MDVRLIVLSVFVLASGASAYNCYECRAAMKYFFEFAATPEEVALSYEELSATCNEKPTAQEEMDCLINVAGWWPDILDALGDAEVVFSHTCLILENVTGLVTCPYGDNVKLCGQTNCVDFITEVGSLDPKFITNISNTAIEYLRGDAYCTGGGLTPKPDNCKTFVAKLEDVFLELIPRWAIQSTANRYCENYICPSDYEGETERMLDGMVQVLEGSGIYDRKMLQDLEQCSIDLDDVMIPVTDLNWAGMKKYANTHGQPGDLWEPCFMQDVERWFEVNCTTQEYGKVPIWEPCNYASNMAYYHTAIEICKRDEAKWSLDDEWSKKNNSYLTFLVTYIIHCLQLSECIEHLSIWHLDLLSSMAAKHGLVEGQMFRSMISSRGWGTRR